MPSASLYSLLQEFPSGIIIIADGPEQKTPVITYSNSIANQIFNISQAEKDAEIMKNFQIECKKYQKREFNKLTNITLYDEIFKNENTNKTEGWFFGDSIILIKMQFLMNYTLISVDNLTEERKEIRNKLLKSISYQHLNTLHHELNNPLNNLINTVEEIEKQRLNLSVFLIKTVIKKFILYSKNIFDEALQSEQDICIFSIKFMFEKLFKKFKTLYDYKHITFDIDKTLKALDSFTIKSFDYYFKEFVRNLLLLLYYEVPKNSAVSITVDYVETSQRLSMSFRNDNKSTVIAEPENVVDTAFDNSLDDDNRVQTIEITKEIIMKIAVMLNANISFPENCDIILVFELNNVMKGADLSDDSDDNVEEFSTERNKIVDVPIFSSMATFNYLKEGLKGIGKNSSKIITQNIANSKYESTASTTITSKKNQSVNSSNSNSFGNKTRPSTTYMRVKTYGGKLMANRGYTEGKRKTKKPLNSIAELNQRNKDSIIDKYTKSPSTNTYLDIGYSNNVNCKSYTRMFYTNMGNNKSNLTQDCPLNGLTLNTQYKSNLLQNQPSMKSSYNYYNSNSKRRGTNISCYNIKKNSSLTSIFMDDDIQFKTKKFPSKKMITISPLERNNLLNNSFCQTATNIDTIVNEEPHQSPRLNSHTLNEFSLRKKDILLVDDEDFNLITLQSCLKAERLLADTASNGEEGIQKIKENGNYKLIFMDVCMPVMDGIQACRIIQELVDKKEINTKVSVLILSGHSKETVWYHMEKLSVVKRFVQKPLTRKKLKNILQDYYY